MSFARENGGIETNLATLDSHAANVRAWICVEVGKRTLTNVDIADFVYEQYPELYKAERDYVANKAKYPDSVE